MDSGKRTIKKLTAIKKIFPICSICNSVATAKATLGFSILIALFTKIFPAHCRIFGGYNFRADNKDR